MNKKIIGIFVCMLFILSGFTSVAFNIPFVDKQYIASLKTDYLDSVYQTEKESLIDNNIVDTFGKSWDIAVVDSKGNVGKFSSIAIDNKNGYPSISYQDITDIDSPFLKYANWTGSKWINTTVDNEIGGFYTSLALDSKGYPHISYQPHYQTKGLKYANWTGKGWNKIWIRDDIFVVFSDIALDSRGFPHISISRKTSGILYIYEWNGTDWVGSSVYKCDPNCNSIAVDSSGRNHIAFQNTEKDTLEYATGMITSDNFITKTIDNNLDFMDSLSIALDSKTYPHISYYDSANGDLKYAYWDGSKWIISIVDGNHDAGLFSSIALNSMDNPRISYLSSSGVYYSLMYAKWTGSKWVKETVDDTSAVGKYNSLALDSYGNPHISYWDQTNGDLKYAYKTETNKPPKEPFNPFPGDTDYDISIFDSLSWSGGDDDMDDTVVYDVYMKAGAPPTINDLVSRHQSGTIYKPSRAMMFETTYYWKIVAWDSYGNKTEGDLWSFKTKNNPFSEWIKKLMDFTYTSDNFTIEWVDKDPGNINDYYYLEIPFDNSYIPKINHSNNVIAGLLSGDYLANCSFRSSINILYKPYINKYIITCSDLDSKYTLEIIDSDNIKASVDFGMTFNTANWVNSSIYVKGDCSIEFPIAEIQASIGLFPFTIEIICNVKLEFQTNINSPVNWENPINYVKIFDNKGLLAAGITVKGGVGCQVLSLGVYGIVNYTCYINREPDGYTRGPKVCSSIYGELGFYAQVWMLEQRWKIYNGIWENCEGSLSEDELLKSTLTNKKDFPIKNPYNWSVIPRDYGNPVWQNKDKGILIKEVLPICYPSMAMDVAHRWRMMVWGYDNKLKKLTDGFELQYAISDPEVGTWSTPRLISDNKFFEMYPSIGFLSNGDAICVFNYLNNSFSNMSGYNDTVIWMDVGYYYFNHTAYVNNDHDNIWKGPFKIPGLPYDPVKGVGSPQEPSRKFNFRPIIVTDRNNAAVVWTYSDENNIFLKENHILAQFWDNSLKKFQDQAFEIDTCVPTPVLNPLSAVLRNGKLSIAYVKNNGVINPTIDDREIYVANNFYGQETIIKRITDDRILDYSPSINYVGDTLALTWIRAKDKNSVYKYNTTYLMYKEIYPEKPERKILEGNISNPKLFYAKLTWPMTLNTFAICWKDFNNEKLLVTYFNNITPSNNTYTVYKSSKLIDQAFWDLTDYGFFAAFIERDNVTSLKNCNYIYRTLNNPPNKPNSISGPATGIPGSLNIYQTSNKDKEEDQIYYIWDWGDNTSNYTGPYKSGETVTASHKWSAGGTYSVKVKSIDTNEDESIWSDLFIVTISKNKIFNNAFLNYLQNYLNQFPIIQKFIIKLGQQ